MEAYTRWQQLAKKELWVRESLLELREDEKQDSFYKSLEFGTAGMRGLLGVGPNRINVYTVAKANKGYAKYLIETFGTKGIKVAIAYDNRHQSRELAEVSARVLSTYGIESYVFTQPRPTPELSFALRHLNCVGGIVITASHNPREYNGYKVYDETGCQLVDSKISKVIEYVGEIEDETTIDIEAHDASLIHELDKTFDRIYLDALKTITIRPNIKKDLKIVLSSQHGTAYPILVDVLEELGYHVIVVEEQSSYDPDFTNTRSPNPEDLKSYELPLEYAKRHDADLILVCDPDADRMGIAVKHGGSYRYLTGNQGGAILQEYIYRSHRELKTMPKHPIMFNTIVTSDLGEKIAQKYGVAVEKTLTGFKYIGEKIEAHNRAQDHQFVFGYEESYGYLIADFVRDKDALQACILVSEAANYYHNQNKTLIDILFELFGEHGFYVDSQISLTLSGSEGLERIQRLLSYFRNHSLNEIAGIQVINKEDYWISKDSHGNTLDYPQSNVIKYFLEDGSWVAIRPSGTEPKCKIYYCVCSQTYDASINKFNQLNEAMQILIDTID